MAVRHVLLMSQEPGTIQQVTAALASNGRLLPEAVFTNLPALVGSLEQTAAPAVLVDVDPQAGRMLAALEPVIRRFEQTRFVLLTREARPDLLLEAMQIGARLVLQKGSIEQELTGALRRMCPAESQAHEGVAVTVLSASGGCGATTVAVNVAWELQEGGSERVLLVDLDTAYGTIPAYLGVKSRYGIVDLLGRSGPLDSELIATTAVEAGPRMHVLTTTGTEGQAEMPGLLDAARLGEAVGACKQAYPWTVLDAPRLALGLAAELAQASQTVLLVMQATVTDLRVARRVLAGLAERGVPEGRIVPVINRYRARGMMIELEEAEHALGRSGVEHLSNDYQSAIQAINYGQALAQAAPRSALRRDVQRLARQIRQELTVSAGAGAVLPAMTR